MIAAFIAMVMTLALCATVFAAGTNSITVDVNFSGQAYKLYKIFNATVNEEREEATDANSESSVMEAGIAYTLIDEDTTANSGHGLTAEYSITKADGTAKTVTAGNWFEYVNGSDKNIKIQANADITTEEFRLFAEKYGVKIGETLTAETDNDPNIKWESLDDGYYFITTTTGTLVTVDSVAPDAIVKDKNTVPTVDKTVEEDSTGVYQKQNDAEIGQTVNFKTVIAAKKGGTGYKLFDKLGAGLAFDGVGSIKVYKGSIAEDNLLTSGTDYTATAGGIYTPADTEAGTESVDADFTVEFTQAFLNSISTDTDLIITYTATVTGDAVLNTAIPNKTVLEYGNKTRTAESETRTYVWGIDLLKTDGKDSTELKDAEFVLYKKVTETPAEGDPTTSIYYAKFDDNQKFTGWTAADTETVANLVKKEKAYFTAKDATVLKTGSDGTFAVSGLDEGEYFLIEVTAPAGYNKLDEEQPVTITSTSASAGATLENALTSGTNGSTHTEVKNNQGSVLPATGSIGTTIFYVVGAVLVLGAGVLLVARRKTTSR